MAGALGLRAKHDADGCENPFAAPQPGVQIGSTHPLCHEGTWKCLVCILGEELEFLKHEKVPAFI